MGADCVGAIPHFELAREFGEKSMHKTVELALPWNVPLLDFFEELGHAIAYLDDRKNVQDSFVAEIIFGNGDNIHSISHKCTNMGYDTSVLEQIFIMHLDGLNNDEVRTDAEILQGIFNKKDIPAIVTGYGDRIIGFMNDCTEARDHYHMNYTGYLPGDIRFKEIMIDSSMLGTEGTADFLVEAVKKKFEL